MRGKIVPVGVLLALAAAALLGLAARRPAAEPPFGGPRDVAFARRLAKAIQGYEKWKLTTTVYKGASPHGKWVRLFATWVKVDGRHHPVIIKDNYRGRGVTPERIRADRRKWLRSVTVMLQREAGYDPDNQNWFWAKYKPDGTLEKNARGVLLAGRVAKGQNRGCLSCHAQAHGKDFLFSNDP